MFHPTDVRIESNALVGANYSELTVTSAEQKVTASFDTKSRGFLSEGATVTLDLGDDGTTEGTISEVESTVSQEGSRSISVTIVPKTPIPTDVERVTITVSRDAATDVLIVPVRAILALAGGGYALELDGPSGPTLTRVELGAVVDDLAEISGDFSEGDDVVIPADIFGSDS